VKNDDLLFVLIGITLPALFVLASTIAALVLRLNSPKRFRTLRMLLCLPLIGSVAGFPIGFMMGGADPGLIGRLKFGALCGLWFGNGCTTGLMLLGLLVLGVATLAKKAGQTVDS